MDRDDRERPSPEVIFVPPPVDGAVPRKRLIGIVIWVVFVCGIMLILSLTVGLMPVRIWGVMTGSMLATVIVVFSLVSWRSRKAMRDQRREFLEKHPGVEDDSFAQALGKAWKTPDRLPKLDDVRAALADYPRDSGTDAARIYCFGQADVPEIGRLHFEPVIITPTGVIWRQLIWLIITGVILGVWLLDYLHLLPSWMPSLRPFMSGAAYFLVAGAITLGVWIWKGMIRPTYIRMAPGVIQVLEYGYSKTKPLIRSYPMDGETLVFFTCIRTHLILTLARGDDKDVLAFSRMREPQQKVARAWQALLSTAPTPPLSDDALVG